MLTIMRILNIQLKIMCERVSNDWNIINIRLTTIVKVRLFSFMKSLSCVKTPNSVELRNPGALATSALRFPIKMYFLFNVCTLHNFIFIVHVYHYYLMD